MVPSQLTALAGWAVLLSSLPASSLTSADRAPPEQNDGDDAARCGIYLAESTIPNAGLGLYSGRPAPSGTDLGYLPPLPGVRTGAGIPAVADVCVALPDMDDGPALGVINDYEWESGHFGTESEGSSIDTLCPGFGMLANGHMLLYNIKEGYVASDDGGLHRSARPGAGAVTRYHNLTWGVSADLPAGAELFIDYGPTYWRDRPRMFKDDTDVMNKLISIYGANEAGVDRKATSKASKARVVEVYRDAVLGTLSADKVSDLSPKTVEEVKKVASESTRPAPIRSVEWLERHGMCADNLRAGPSTNPQAGRGAFAVRHIPKGKLVAPAPAIYFPQEDLFDLGDGTFEMEYPDGRKGHQLILNYMIGHPDTSMLLFPYSSTVNLINHNSTAPNAEMQWSSSEHHNKDLLETEVDDLDEDGGTGLLLEFIALRDIGPGEEVFIDYGREWEKAWEDHVSKWKPREDAGDYVDAAAFDAAEGDKAVRTMREQREEPYPDNIRTACYFAFPNNIRQRTREALKGDRLSTPILEYRWDEPEENMDRDYYLRHCDVLNRDEVGVAADADADALEAVWGDQGNDRKQEELYKARIYNLPPDTAESIGPMLKFDLLVTDIPRRAVKFVDQMQSTDQHLEGVFRHPIGMPDGMLPESWRNLPEGV